MLPPAVDVDVPVAEAAPEDSEAEGSEEVEVEAVAVAEAAVVVEPVTSVVAELTRADEECVEVRLGEALIRNVSESLGSAASLTAAILI